MKRIAVLLAAATAALAFASSASANPYLAVSGNGVADGNYFAFAAVHIFDADGGGFFLNPIQGNLRVIAMDPSGTMHSYGGVPTCMSINSTKADVLFRVTGKFNEPAGLYGVLVSVTDPEAANSENGVGDRIAYTNLNSRQYAEFTTNVDPDSLSCPTSPAGGRRPLSAGNISVADGSSYVPYGQF